MGELTIVLPGERCPSWNKYWAGVHRSKRQEDAKRIHAVVQERLRQMGIEPGTTCNKRVEIEIIAYFDKRVLDSSNVCGKPYEDALKGWLIVDDTPKHVDGMITRSRKDAANPRVEITLREVEG